MPTEKTKLHQRLESGQPLLLAEISPPTGADPGPFRAIAKRMVGAVHALGISDNRDRVCMSSMAAAVIAAEEGVEPIVHVVTRDRNRIALVSDCLGAQALGLRNLLCTSGNHQTLGAFGAARNVFDLDSVQLLQAYAELASDGAVVGEKAIADSGPLCLGAAASVYADPVEMQVLRLNKKVHAGARFLITQPVFDLERFNAWWQEVARRGLHEKAAIVAGVRPLVSAEKANEYATGRPSPRIPEAVLSRIASKTSPADQRAAGIDIALETIDKLRTLRGLRGFQISVNGDVDAAMEVIEKSA